MKIFISIASYRDPLLTYTLTEAYNNAVHKDNLFFGVIEQASPEEAIDTNSFTFNKQIRYVRIDPQQSRGCCWARSLAQTLYNGEDFFFQIDSHTGFDSGWDIWFINSMHELMKYHRKPLMTIYPNTMKAENDDITKEITKNSDLDTSAISVLVPDLDSAFKNDGYYVGQASHRFNTVNKFVHGFLLSAGNFFTVGAAIEEVPYDPFLFFSGEEQSLAMRFWTNGYNIFHGNYDPIYHYYGAYKKFETNKKLFWNESEDSTRTQKWWDLEERAQKRLKEIVTGKLSGKYGLGTTRSLHEYILLTGINHTERNCEPRAYDGKNIFFQDYREKLTYSKTSSGIPPIPIRIPTPDIRKRLTND